MARLLEDQRIPVLKTMMEILNRSAGNPLVTFELHRRLDNVPKNLLELFFLAEDSTQIENWHRLQPDARLGWVNTLLRYRCPGANITFTMPRNTTILTYMGGWFWAADTLPRNTRRVKNYWKGMDDYCLLLGVCFNLAVQQLSDFEPRTLFDDPEAINAN